jgi:hypothetical protein
MKASGVEDGNGAVRPLAGGHGGGLYRYQAGPQLCSRAARPRSERSTTKDCSVTCRGSRPDGLAVFLSAQSARRGCAELVDILENRELGSADAVTDRAGLPVGAFGPDQAGDERIDPLREAHFVPTRRNVAPI